VTPEDEGLVRVFVDALSERFAGVGTTVTDPEAVRAKVSSEAPPLPPIDLPVVADENAGDVPVRRYQPAARLSDRVVVYAHGGGWVIGDLDSHDRLCRRLARDLCSDVVAVGYRRAPEHRFPAALDDFIAVLRWAAGRWGAVAIAGDSSGGNLAAAALLSAPEVAINAALLIYPVLDARMASLSYAENAEGWFLTADLMRWFWRCYLADDDGRSPLASPALAADDQLAAFPPTVIVTAERDPLRDEGDAFAARLAATGVDVDHVRATGLFHSFFSLDELLPPAVGPVATAVAAFRRRLWKHPSSDSGSVRIHNTLCATWCPLSASGRRTTTSPRRNCSILSRRTWLIASERITGDGQQPRATVIVLGQSQRPHHGEVAERSPQKNAPR
jgi:acetyl esterase